MKIKIPKENYVGMYKTKVVKSGNGAVVNSYKKYIGKKAIVLIIDDYDLVGKDGSFDKMELD